MKYPTAGQKRKNRSFAQLLFHLPYFNAFVSAAVTLFFGVALFSYDPYDPSWFYYSSEPLLVANHAGRLGAQCAAFCFYVWGSGAYILLGIGSYLTYVFLRRWPLVHEFERALAWCALLFTWPALLYMHGIGNTAYMIPGGCVGQRFFEILYSRFDMLGTALCIYSLLVMQFLVISRLSFLYVFLAVQRVIVGLVAARGYWLTPCVRLLYGFFRLTVKLVGVLTGGLWRCVKKMYGGQDTQILSHTFESSVLKEGDDTHSGLEHRQDELHLAVPANSVSARSKSSAKKNEGIFKLPALSLFSQAKKEDGMQRDESKQVAAVLEEKLSRFGVVGSVVAIKKGPVVTLFEYQPAIETKLSRIITLADDLALALEAVSVRIVAPIPGTSRVGFEVSNKERKPVLFGESIRSQAYQNSSALLPIILGQDTAGNQVVVDLADMPHLLVAGSTGSGKSVALNAMVISLLCRLRPDQLQLIIIDPKRLEFAPYQDIPHLLFPIITDPHRAAPVIKWLVRVMEDRYQLMAEYGVRSIHEYKKKRKEAKLPDELPFIVLMIDELADLMMVAGRECEESIARLAQMARAAGIHLIVATQRPSVDVVTGVIKVNFPSRISFRLTSKIDSRTILDTGGAESLLGKGDMLFMDAHSARIRRVHGAYLSDTEIKKVADALRAEQKVEYKDLQEAVALYQARHNQEESDVLLPELLQFLQTVDQVSISLLQRRFSIGYNRSARLMELLEMQGKVMPADGSKTRKVIH